MKKLLIDVASVYVKFVTKLATSSEKTKQFTIKVSLFVDVASIDSKFYTATSDIYWENFQLNRKTLKISNLSK